MASQTSLLTTSHTDLITSLSFNLYGTKLVTSSLDHSIRITELTTSTNLWDKNLIQFKASETSLVKVVWSHPSFGNILASASIDGIIKIWLEKDAIATTTTMDAKGTAGKKWFNTASLTDARGSMRDLEFCPVEFGLKLAAISSDSHLRLWECLDPIGLSEWSLIEDIDLNHLPYNPSSSSTLLSSGISSQTIPGISQSGFETNASTSLGSNSGSPSKFGHPEAGVTHARGTIESDGGWSLAWCKEAWWGERLAVSSGTTGIIRLFHLPDHAPWSNYLNLLPPSTHPSTLSPISSLAWSPSSGRSFQLLASGSRDGKARVYKIHTPSLSTPSPSRQQQQYSTMDSRRRDNGQDEEEEDGEWRAEMDSELEQKVIGERNNNGPVGEVKVEWNLTGTVLSTSGADARVRLWKSTYTGQWRVVATLTTEEDYSGEGMTD